MVESVVTSVLNSVLKQYIKEFDKHSIDLSLWKGQALISKVELKPNALDFLNLPISIKLGYVGSIKLYVDWKRLNSVPAKIELNDIRIVIGPRSNFEMTKDMENELNKQKKLTKKSILDSWEAVTLIPQNDSVKTKNKPDSSYTQRLIEKIIDNIHININNIHIRYEDNVKNRNFSFGISIKSLNAVTTNANYQEEFQNQTNQYVYKIANLHGFSIYLNTKSVISDDKFMLKYFDFKNIDNKIFDGYESRQYIIEPCGLELKIIMNKNVKKDEYRIPQIDIKGQMKNLSFQLGQDQFTDLLAILSNISIATSYGEYLSYKPKNITIEEAPKKYWKWAINCVKRDEKRKRSISWRKLVNFQKDRDTYIGLYIRKLNATWLPELNKNDVSGIFVYICTFYP